MKKTILLLSAISSLFLLSCSKEAKDVQTEQATKSFTITAAIDEQTKTAYEDERVFSWTSADCLTLVVENGTWNNYTLHSTGEGTVTDFSTQTLGAGYNESGYALYPAFYTWNGEATQTLSNGTYLNYNKGASTSGGLILTLNSVISQDSSNPLSMIPLIGKKTGTPAVSDETSDVNSTYVFGTAVGILKFTIDAIPQGADKIVLQSTTYPLSGSFSLAEEDGHPYLAAANRTSENAADLTKAVTFTWAAGPQDFYFPLPVGTIPVNDLTVKIYKAEELLISAPIKTSLEIQRNHIVKTPTLSLPWNSKGNAKFVDYYIIQGGSLLFDWAASKWYVESELQQFKTSNSYRLKNPYYKYHTSATENEWLYFTINDDKTVTYPALFNTTLVKGGYYVYFTTTDAATNKVSSGTAAEPASLQLSPAAYYVQKTAYTGGAAKNNVIGIVFPGKEVTSDPVGTFYVNGDARFQVTITKDGDTYKLTQFAHDSGSTVDYNGETIGSYDAATRTLTFTAANDASNRYPYVGEDKAAGTTITMKFQYDGRLFIGQRFGIAKDAENVSGMTFGSNAAFGEPYLSPAL